MVSSDTGGGGLSDCSVGSIVWVRRRNGSWWPGKILGLEELWSAVVTSPRSGTPVKLLGRDDASVDWYNLEKSKRVKAFRCGEFDDCIERAEAAQGMPPKKREKYARREDAILHALELERQLLEKKHGNFGSSSNGVAKMSPEAVTSSEYLESGGGKHKDLRSDELPERLGSSFAEKNVTTDQHLHDETLRERNQLSGDDDCTGMLPRMRGLQDFGLRTAPPMREELSGGTFHTRRSRYAYLPYGTGDYSNDNQTISSQMEIPVSRFERRGYPVDVGHNSGSTDDTETDCSETDSLELDSEDETNGLSDGSASIELLPKYPRRIGTQEEHGSISSNDDLDELGGFAESTSTGASKWHLKRKRNSRSLGKRSVDKTDVEGSRADMIGRNTNWSNIGFKADFVDSRSGIHISRYPSSSLHSPNERGDLEGVGWNNHPTNRVCWEDLLGYYMDPFLDGRHHVVGRTMLIDVEMKVDANNYRRDVPMISMVSKLNGHAIVGHPIQVEALERGSSGNLVSATDYFYPEHAHLPSVWRTGRRTANARVPRPFLSSLLNPDTKRQAHIVNQDSRLLLRNPSQKISPSSSQKIRKLSSIASEHKNQSDPRCGCRNYQVDGQVKNEKAPKTVACIPVTLVFRRLHEELFGHHQ